MDFLTYPLYNSHFHMALDRFYPSLPVYCPLSFCLQIECDCKRIFIIIKKFNITKFIANFGICPLPIYLDFMNDKKTAIASFALASTYISYHHIIYISRNKISCRVIVLYFSSHFFLICVMSSNV